MTAQIGLQRSTVRDQLARDLTGTPPPAPACGYAGVGTAFQERRAGRARGYTCRLRGKLTFDTRRGVFERFDLLAVGDRWGGTEHNNRQEDLPSSPMGIVFRLADDTPAARTPPHANLRDYFDLAAD